jgi:hypothetical protein
MRYFLATVACLCATPVLAQVPGAMTDANMTCEQYLAANIPDVKTGDAALDKMSAELDGKIKTWCKANPKAKLMEAAEKALQ